MKKFLVGCLLLVSTIALADAPVIWNGTTAKWLPSGLRSLGVAKISSTGVMTSGDISNADVSATASIATSKLEALTASKVAVTDASGFLTASTVNSSDLSLLSSLSTSLANKWDITGNASLNAATNFLGTTDAVDVVFKRNNTELARLQSNGLQAATIYGSSSSGGNLTVRSSSNATVGSVILADQALEKFRVGPTGSTTTYNYSHHILTTNANSILNALAIQENGSNIPTTIGSAGPQGFIFAPKDSGGTSTIVTRVSGADAGQWYVIRASDGSILGEMNYGLAWGIKNNNTGIVAFRVSGVTGQTADLQQWHNTNAYGGAVSSVGPGGQLRGPAGTVSLPGHAFHGDTNNGWWAPAADTQAWSLAGSEALRLDSTGLGIGATASTKLDVNGGARIRGLSTAGPVKTDATGVLSQSAVDLSTEVTGDLPYANFMQSAGLSVLGRATNSTGDVADITAASDDQVLRRSGTSLAFGQVATGGLADASVTAAKANSQFVQGQTTVTAQTTDYVLIADSSDSGNIKKALVSDIAGAGGGSLTDSTKTANYTLTDSDDVVYCDTTQQITISLHAAASAASKMYYLKNVNTGDCLVYSADEIDGETTQVLRQFDAISLFPRGGTTWSIH